MSVKSAKTTVPSNWGILPPARYILVACRGSGESAGDASSEAGRSSGSGEKGAIASCSQHGWHEMTGRRFSSIEGGAMRKHHSDRPGKSFEDRETSSLDSNGVGQ
jgi:hypothetical protein